MPRRQLTEQHVAWALKLTNAQLMVPGVKDTTPATFRGTVFRGVNLPMLFATRDQARKHRRDFRQEFGAQGLRATVVPVRLTVVEFATLEAAERRTS